MGTALPVAMLWKEVSQTLGWKLLELLFSISWGLAVKPLDLVVPSYLGDIACLVPDQCSKVNITIKQGTHFLISQCI